MNVLGVDPDLHRTGWAIVQSDPLELLQVGVVSIPREEKGDQAVIAMRDAVAEQFANLYKFQLAVVESQEVYFAKAKANPNNLVLLAQVSGVCAAETFPIKLWMPRPGVWKGQVPKHIHQARILKAVGLNPVERKDYCFPDPVPDCYIDNVNSQTDWKHVVDAIGLACWGITRSSRLHQISETARRA